MAKQTGFSETAAPFALADTPLHGVLGTDGRLMIPAAIRDAAGIQRGEKVLLTVENGKIVVEGWGAAITRIQDMLAHLKVPGESVVDQFIAERRAESLRESEE